MISRYSLDILSIYESVFNDIDNVDAAGEVLILFTVVPEKSGLVWYT